MVFTLRHNLFMNTNFSKLRTYVRPKVKTLQLAPQSLLATSGNPSITNPPMEWGTQKKSFPWENTKTQNESL